MMFFYKLIRTTAFILILATVFTLLSGFLLVKFNLISGFTYSSYKYVHTVVMPLIFVPVFFLHSLSGIMLLMTRKKTLNKKALKLLAGTIWTLVFIGFGYLYVVDNPPPKNVTLQNNVQTGDAGNIRAVEGGTNSQGSVANNLASLVLSESEISKHNNQNSCWLIISGKVYDVTMFLESHPGEASAILSNCGKDGTGDYLSKGGRGEDHSELARNMLASYYIGDVGQVLVGNNNAEMANVTQNNSNQETVITQTQTSPVEIVSLSMSEVTKHNNSASCWLLVSGKVYDVTTFLNQHPGNASRILPTCGTDATTAYATRGGEGSTHSDFARNLLNSYYIGDLGRETTTNIINSVKDATQVNTGGGQVENENENEIEGKNKNINSDLVKKTFPSATILEMEINDRGGYEAKLLINEIRHEVKVDSSGNIIRDSIDN